MTHAAERFDLPTRYSSKWASVRPGNLAASYRAAGFFVVRSPAQPLARLSDWCDSGDAHRQQVEFHDAAAGDWSARRAALAARLQTEFLRPSMRQAVYFASPEVEELCQAREPLPANLARTLTRYFMRAAGRETPFGLFAGVSLARLANADRFELGPAHDNRAATSVAVCYLEQLLTELASREDARDSLRHVLSSTLVRIDGRYRFTTGKPAQGPASRRQECLTLDLAATPQVDRAVAFAAGGLTPEALARQITGGPIEYTDALEFARTLCRRGLLVADCLPGATGRGPLSTTLAELTRSPVLLADATVLSTVERELAEADAGGTEFGSAPFRAVAAKLNRLTPPAQGRHPLQTALAKPAPKLAMSAATAQLFLDAASLVQRTSKVQDDGALRDFRTRFSERYGLASIPLAEALDSEVGVDFAEARATNPLLKDLTWAAAAAATKPFDDFDRVRQKILHRALGSGRAVYELDDEILAEFPEQREREHEAESFGVIARLARDEGGNLCVVAPSVLPSALKMLARFCDAEPSLVDVLRQQARSEQQLAGDALLADVAYLPNQDVSNILARPVLREYEIPFLGKSGAHPDKQIPIDDLYLQVHGDRVVLYSARHRRRVKVRIANALNHAHGAHPTVYRFLAALQAQDEASLSSGWSWGVLDESEFLPRIVRGSTVLSLARWQLSRRDLEPATSAHGAAAFAATQQLRERLKLPRWLTRGVGDQRLPVDLDNELSVEELLHDGRNSKQGLVLEEMLPGPGQLVLEGPEGHYAGEFVVPFLRRGPLPDAWFRAPVVLGNAAASKSQYPPGSNWLYAKIYAAPSRMDRILKRIRKDVLDPLREPGIADWFYVPFADPHPHLRVRFKGQPSELHGTVLPALQRALEPELASGGAWRLQIDTYDQEQERYGGPLAAELAERIFAADSDACSQLVQLCHRDSDLRWQIALLGIDRLLGDFGFELSERLAIARLASQDYGQEWSADPAMWKGIGVKFRAHRPRLTQLLWMTPELTQSDDKLVLELFARRSSQVGSIWRTIERERCAGRVHASPLELARSFAHMHAIRLLGVEARAHELLLFDFLKRLYESRLARTDTVPHLPASTPRLEHEPARG